MIPTALVRVNEHDPLSATAPQQMIDSSVSRQLELIGHSGGPVALVGPASPTNGGAVAGVDPHVVGDKPLQFELGPQSGSIVAGRIPKGPEGRRLIEMIDAELDPNTEADARNFYIMQRLQTLTATPGAVSGPAATPPANEYPVMPPHVPSVSAVVPADVYAQPAVAVAPPGRPQVARPIIRPQGQSAAVKSVDQAEATPAVAVTFHIPGFGSHKAYYHAVIEQPYTLVLVHRARSLVPCFFPSPSESAGGEQAPRPFALTVEQPAGPARTFTAYATGLTFGYNGDDFCILTVEPEA